MKKMFSDAPLHLRALEPEDLDWLYQLENDETLWPWGAANVPYSRYAFKHYIAQAHYDLYVDQQMRLVVEADDIELPGKTTIVGCVDLMNFSPRHNRAEVGIIIFPRFRGRGLGKQVLRMLVNYATRHVFLHQLYAVVSQHNEAAGHLFVKAGFQFTAILPQWLRVGDQEYVSAHVFTLTLEK